MKSIFLSFALVLTGCSIRSSEKNYQWTEADSPEQLKLIQSEISKADWKNQPEVFFAGYRILHASEVIRQVDVSHAYSKTVRHLQDGQLSQLQARIVRKGLLPLFKRSPNESAIQSEFFQIHPELASGRVLDFKPVALVHQNRMVLGWKLILETNSEVSAFTFDSGLRILQKERLSSSFDTKAILFPKGARHSQLTDVVLLGLNELTLLSGDRVRVTSEATDSNLNTQETLAFKPSDLRFDQVQSYYYLDSSLSWFEQKFGYKPYRKLEAIVEMGYPDKTNSAFYYDGKIRLGSGDGEVYEHIPQDPSIVIHESAHSVVEAVAHLPFEGEGGSLNEGFADFFACVQLGTPYLGELSYKKAKYKRNLNDVILLSEKNGGLYHDSQILSGVLWQFYQQFGEDQSLKLASRLLVELSPASTLDDLKSILPRILPDVMDPQSLKSAQQILTSRGLM